MNKINLSKGKKGFQIIDFCDRFWSKVNKTQTCWVWTGSQNPISGKRLPNGRREQIYPGYGMIWNGKRNILATHASWFLYHNLWPSQFILHKCDNPPCIRPDHLFEGTLRDNLLDCMKKSRYRGGGKKNDICKRGHSLLENPISNKFGRQCRICSNNARNIRNAKIRELKGEKG